MRAELFSSDFLISFFIFLSALLIITAYYQNLQTDVYETNLRNDMYSKAIVIASLLATTSGHPQYWDSTNVEVIGFYDSGKFNLTKFEYLINDTSYQEARIKLGTGVYNFLITLKSNNTDFVIQKFGTDYNYSYGMIPTNEEQVLVVKRLGVVNNSGIITKATLEVILWE